MKLQQNDNKYAFPSHHSYVCKLKTKMILGSERGGSRLQSQHFGRPRRVITRSRDRDHPSQHGETLSLLKIQKKISQVWWRVLVIPASWEAETGELLEPGR